MNNKQTIYLILAIFITTALLLVLFLIYPIFSDIRLSSKRILHQRAQMQNMELEDRQLTIFKEKYKEYQSNLLKIDKLLVDANNPIDFITFLESVARDINILTEIKLLATQAKNVPKWPTLTFQILANGSFSNIMAFSQKLETGPYLIKVQRLSITKEEILAGKEKTVGMQADMIIQVVIK